MHCTVRRVPKLRADDEIATCSYCFMAKAREKKFPTYVVALAILNIFVSKEWVKCEQVWVCAEVQLTFTHTVLFNITMLLFRPDTIFLFSAQFRLKIFLWTLWDQSVWHFCFNDFDRCYINIWSQTAKQWNLLYPPTRIRFPIGRLTNSLG